MRLLQQLFIVGFDEDAISSWDDYKRQQLRQHGDSCSKVSKTNTYQWIRWKDTSKDSFVPYSLHRRKGAHKGPWRVPTTAKDTKGRNALSKAIASIRSATISAPEPEQARAKSSQSRASAPRLTISDSSSLSISIATHRLQAINGYTHSGAKAQSKNAGFCDSTWIAKFILVKKGVYTPIGYRYRHNFKDCWQSLAKSNTELRLGVPTMFPSLSFPKKRGLYYST